MKKNELTESLIQKIKEEINIETLCLEENFFDIGGDSIIALSLCDFIYEKTDIQIKLHSFFSFKDIHSIINHIWDSKQSPQRRNTQKQNNERRVLDRIPLNKSQKLIYSFCKTNPESTANNITTALKLPETLNIVILKDRIKKLSERYDVFRFNLLQDTHDVYFVDTRKSTFQLNLYKMTEEEAISHIQENIKRPIQLGKEEILQFSIYETDRSSIIYTKFHHILVDGLSNTEVFKQLFLEDKGSIPLDFQDFHHIENEYISSEDYQRDKIFWEDKLESGKAITNISPSEQLANTLRLKLSHHETKQIENAMAIYQVSFFQMVYSIHALVLRRITKQDEICIGVPMHGRIKTRYFKSIGNFINTLPIKQTLVLSQTIREYIAYTKNQLDLAMTHQKFPTIDLIQMAAKEGHLSVYSTIFSYLDISDIVTKLKWNNIFPIEINRPNTFSPLDIYIHKNNDELEICIEYTESLEFHKELSKYDIYFKEILSNLLKEDMSLKSILGIEKSSRPSIIKSESGYSFDENENLFYNQIINLLKNDQSCAEDKSSFYQGSELYEKIGSFQQQVTSFIKNKIDGPIILILPRKVESICMQLALICEGIPFIPVDPEMPHERIEQIIKTSKAHYYINNTSIPSDHLQESCLIPINVNSDSTFRPEIKERNRYSACYILFTSGTTGNPKGVEVSYHNLNYFLKTISKEIISTQQTRALAQTTFSFDITFLEYLYPLLNKGYFYIIDKNEKLNIGKLAHLVIEKNINFIQATPSFWRILTSSNWPQIHNLVALAGGEPLDRELAKKIKNKSNKLYNMYGPTETTIWSSLSEIEDNAPISIGTPLPGTDFYILDSHKNPVSIGEKGELYITGHGVSNGYINNEQQTQKSFLKRVINDSLYNDTVFYKTGDLVTYDGDALIYNGRIDSQIKVNGHRIEINEIAGQISNFIQKKYDANYNFIVLPLKKEYTTTLNLVLEIKNSTELNSKILFEELTYFLKKKIPLYMIPSSFYVIEEIPIMINGKVNFNELKKTISKLDRDKKKKSQRLYQEDSLITHLCADILSLATIPDKKQSFFSLGGNSINALDFIEQIEDIYGIDLSLDDFFQAKDLSSLNSLIHSLQKTEQLNGDHYKYIVNFNRFDSRNDNIFFIHGIGGDVINYQHFKYLDGHQNIFGIRSNGIRENFNPSLSINDMAKQYVNEILELKPEGSITLIGGSMGGVIAFEMANIMENRKMNLKEIIILDTYFPSIPSIQRYLLIGIKFWKEYLKNRLSAHKDEINQYSVIELRNLFALATYRPTQLSKTPLTLVKATLNEALVNENDWKGYTKAKFNLTHIDSTHENIIENFKLFSYLKSKIKN